MIVTQMEAMAKGRCKIYLDDSFAFVLYKAEIKQYNISQDSCIDESCYQEILQQVLIPRAKKRALHLLEKMSRSEKNLSMKLREGGYPEVVVEAALAYVKSYGYIDDLRYAQDYIQEKQGSKSKKEIMALLFQKGIDNATARLALEQHYEEADSEAQAIAYILQRKRYDRETADHKEKQKMYQYLARKGFGYDQITCALKVDTY